MLARASPLKPRVNISLRSSAVEILLVAWLTNAFLISSREIPQPLSVILIYEMPPFLISTVILSAPASIEFSTNCLAPSVNGSLRDSNVTKSVIEKLDELGVLSFLPKSNQISFF